MRMTYPSLLQLQEQASAYKRQLQHQPGLVNPGMVSSPNMVKRDMSLGSNCQSKVDTQTVRHGLTTGNLSMTHAHFSAFTRLPTIPYPMVPVHGEGSLKPELGDNPLFTGNSTVPNHLSACMKRKPECSAEETPPRTKFTKFTIDSILENQDTDDEKETSLLDNSASSAQTGEVFLKENSITLPQDTPSTSAIGMTHETRHDVTSHQKYEISVK